MPVIIIWHDNGNPTYTAENSAATDYEMFPTSENIDRLKKEYEKSGIRIFRIDDIYPF